MKRLVPQLRAAQISVVNRQRRVPVDARLYRRWLYDLLLLTRQTPSIVGLTIVSDRRMHQLNRRYRGIDRTTDVLAFPARDFHTIHRSGGGFRLSPRPPHRRYATYGRWGLSGGEEHLPLIQVSATHARINILGDIVISIDTAGRQAREARAALRDECCRLVIHGYLHLLGYDHERSRREAVRMRRLERRLEAQLTGPARRTQ
jgi:rRNA maturation RNase YbeY